MHRMMIGGLLIVGCWISPTFAQELEYQWTGDRDDQLGYSVSEGGDIDGDGVADVIVGVVEYDDHRGKVTVYSGRDGSVIHKVFGRRSDDALGPGDYFGFRVANLGDINVDGHDDFLVGAPYADGNGRAMAGNAFVFSGLDGSVLQAQVGSTAEEWLGLCVDRLGDLNADGVQDYGVGAGDLRGSFRGFVNVYSGQDGTLMYRVNGLAANDRFGFSFGPLEDLDGDSVNDFIIGAPEVGDPGYAIVYSGATGSSLFAVQGYKRHDNFGHGVAAQDDIDGDGTPDFAVSGYQRNFDAPYRDKGFVDILSGVDGSVIRRLHGNLPFDLFGWDIDDAGDVNGDGMRDLIVCAYGNDGDTGGWFNTYAQVHSGSDGALLFDVTKNTFGDDGHVRAVSGVQDVNQDGFDDVVIGVPKDGPVDQNRGVARVLLGDDLFLCASSEELSTGDRVDLFVRGGLPGSPGALVVEGIDGVPVFAILSIGLFDAQGTLTLTGIVPAGFGGHTYTLRGYASGASDSGPSDSRSLDLTVQ